MKLLCAELGLGLGLGLGLVFGVRVLVKLLCVYIYIYMYMYIMQLVLVLWHQIRSTALWNYVVEATNVTHSYLEQVLKRAIPEEVEKSMKTASGKTFTRSS